MSPSETTAPLSPFLLLAPPAFAQPAQEVGAWRLACVQDRMTDRATCSLKAKEWVEKPAGSTPGLALEVIDRRGRLVPAVTARAM